MARRLRFVPDRSLVEVTCRTVQARFLLKPGRGWQETFIGALARAQQLYPVEVHAFVCLSNHFHLLVTPKDARELAHFMRHFLSKLSLEAGRRHRWNGPLFQRRYQAILVSDERYDQIGRLRYVLAHGVKENLVARTADWPGPHCAAALLEETPLAGIWHDRTREWAAMRRGENRSPSEFQHPLWLTLAPLPCWRHLSSKQRRHRVRELVEQIDTVAAEQRRRGGIAYSGPRVVLDQDPHGGPQRPKRSPAPFCHAARKRIRCQLWSAYAAFVAAYREAATRLLGGDRAARFPEGSFPPPIPFALAAT